VSTAFLIAGLLTTLAGACVLSLRDLGGGRGFAKPTWGAVVEGLPRREATLGFPLIALGTVLQIMGLLT
jgi:hypothetical protein